MIRYEEFIKNFADEFSANSIVNPEEFPDMELYADQVSNLISSKLTIYGKDPLLTKSMISNYVKKGLIPPPEKKKYNRTQMIMMELVLWLKSCYSMDEIEAMMKPSVENYQSEFDEQIDYYEMYAGILPFFEDVRKDVSESVLDDIGKIKEVIRGTGIDEDYNMEMLIVLISIALRVDTAMLLGKKMLKEYFEETKKPSKELKPAKEAKPAKESKPIKEAKPEKEI